MRACKSAGASERSARDAATEGNVAVVARPRTDGQALARRAAEPHIASKTLLWASSRGGELPFRDGLWPCGLLLSPALERKPSAFSLQAEGADACVQLCEHADKTLSFSPSVETRGIPCLYSRKRHSALFFLPLILFPSKFNLPFPFHRFVPPPPLSGIACPGADPSPSATRPGDNKPPTGRGSFLGADDHNKRVINTQTTLRCNCAGEATRPEIAPPGTLPCAMTPSSAAALLRPRSTPTPAPAPAPTPASPILCFSPYADGAPMSPPLSLLDTLAHIFPTPPVFY